jgi:hypothetical protein
MVTVQKRMKMLRQQFRVSFMINHLWEDYQNGLFTRKEIIDSLFIVLNDSNKPSLRLKMIDNQGRGKN